jgi:DNA-binding LacI/PurR family transcriptional regulator
MNTTTPAPTRTAAGTRFGRRPTMGDVAAHLGVSRQLVSIVMRDEPGASAETRERVRQAAAELGYSPDTAARMLRRNGSKYLGVLVSLEEGSSLEVVDQMHVAALERGYNLILAARSAYRDEGSAVEELLGYRCEALIMVSSPLAASNLTRLAQRMPIVAVGHPATRSGYDVVHSDGHAGIELAVDHLFELGHRHIVYIDARRLPDSTIRRRGYLAALKRHDLGSDIVKVAGPYTEEAGAQAAAELLARDILPTAVVAGNDHAALGLVGALGRAGVAVPDQVSVTGYDDSRLARLSFLDLTSVRQDPAELGRLAVECALSRIEGRQDVRECRIPVTLTVRSSTARVRSTLSGWQSLR